jgi:hypothetical protein
MRNQLRKKGLQGSSPSKPTKDKYPGFHVVRTKRKLEPSSELNEVDDEVHLANRLDLKKMEKIDPLLAAEEKEIKRLERLLGIKTSKCCYFSVSVLLRTALLWFFCVFSSTGKSKLNIEKLNKEYEVNEGIGEGFGSFLMDLDDLSNGILFGKKNEEVESMFKKQKIEKDLRREDLKRKNKKNIKKDEKYDETSESEEENRGEEDDDDDNLENRDVEDDEVNVGEDEEEGEEEEEEEEEAREERKEKEKELAKFTYKPSPGEDIYGRVIDPNATSSTTTQKYIPPALRNKKFEV